MGSGGAAQASGLCGNGTSSGELTPSLTPNAAGGRPVFPPLQRVQIERIAGPEPTAYGLHLARWDCRRLPEVVVEQAIVGARHDTTVARLLAQASLQPPRSRYGKTATMDERFITQAAKILWRDERVEWLDERDEGGLCVDEKPQLQVWVRRCPPQPLRRGPMARREFEDTREGTVTFLAVLHVYEGTMWGCGLEANDHVHFLGALRRLARPDAWARRLHLLLDNGSSPMAHDTQADLASQPRLRAFYTPPHASGLNQAEWLLRAFSDTYLQRFDPQSCQHLIDHLHASWPEDNRRFAHPFTWSWSCRELYTGARKKATGICSKTYATVH